MNHSGRNCEYFSGLQPKRLTGSQIDFKLPFQHKKAFVRARMMMPSELALHHRHANAMIVHILHNKIFVGLLNRRSFPLEIHGCQRPKRRFLDMRDHAFILFCSIIRHGSLRFRLASDRFVDP